MPSGREVFAWPDATLYFGPAGALSALAYAQDVQISVAWQWKKDLSMASGTWQARTTFTLQDKTVRINIGKLWYQGYFFAAANSATAYSFAMSATDPSIGATASYSIWSAVFESFNVQGAENGIFKASVAMLAPDISGL